MSRKFITLTTDFGLEDPYVGVVKGVILGICPDAQIIDITHYVAPGDILAGAFTIMNSFSYFPKGTIHVCIVDPGVGTDRRAVASRCGDYIFVGPDNGILWPSAKEGEWYQLINTKYFLKNISHTFHGRDIFAPVAAHLALGVPLEQLGSPLKDPVVLDIPIPQRHKDHLLGMILMKDRFGNLITNIHERDIQLLGREGDMVVEISGMRLIGINRTFGDVSQGSALCYIGSSGYLEIGINRGNAWELLRARPGIEVRVTLGG